MGVEQAADEALRAFHDGKLQGGLLLRALARHGAWRVPARLVGDGIAVGKVRDDAGVTWVTAWSGPDAMARARSTDEAWRAEGRFAEVDGTTLIGLLDAGDGLELDPGTPWAVHYKPDQLPLLQEVAAAAGVEALLDEASLSQEPLRLLLAYGGYRLVVRARGEGQALDLAPDAEGRRLLAVFTAADTATAYLDRARPLEAEHGAAHVIQLDGLTLAERVDALDIDGMVFNCMGPVRPRALAKLFARHLLDAAPAPGATA